MIKKKVLKPQQVRRISGGFSFIPHRFIEGGFLPTLSPKELLLYLFLIMVSDRFGLSFYSDKSICGFLQLDHEEYVDTRNKLIKKDLVAFNGTLFQVLELPPKPVYNSDCR